MTDRQERTKFTAVLVLAPLTAGALSLATGWAIDHDPLAGSSASASAAAPTSSPGTASTPPSLHLVEAKVAAATRRYETARLALLDVERRIHWTSQRVAVLQKKPHGSSAVPGSGGVAAQVPSVPTSTPAPAPAPPPVNTTTGAS